MGENISLLQWRKNRKKKERKKGRKCLVVTVEEKEKGKIDKEIGRKISRRFSGRKTTKVEKIRQINTEKSPPLLKEEKDKDK